MVRLPGNNSRVDLGGDVALFAPGLLGEAHLQTNGPSLRDRAGNHPTGITDGLSSALVAAGMELLHAVEITPKTGLSTEAVGIRTGEGRHSLARRIPDPLVLQVPKPGPKDAVVLMMTDVAGVVSWHFPTTPSVTTVRSAGTIEFVIPAKVAAGMTVRDVEQTPARRLFDGIGKKLLSVLIYPQAGAATKITAKAIASAYEKRNRQYGVRRFTIAEARIRGEGALDHDGWRRLMAGRALLFIHGIFDTSHGGFALLSDAVLEELAVKYGDRVFAFDHPSISVDPVANVREFLRWMPSDVSLDLDIVCHSRGGLVARVLAGELADVDTDRLRVHRIVFVGTPNAGTALADPKNIGDLIDRYSSLSHLPPHVPFSTVEDLLEGVLEVVKIIGQSALGSLPGLAAMDPRGRFLRGLNRDANEPPRRSPERYAIDADFEPTGKSRNSHPLSRWHRGPCFR
jgi:hypothetical protein